MCQYRITERLHYFPIKKAFNKVRDYVFVIDMGIIAEVLAESLKKEAQQAKTVLEIAEEVDPEFTPGGELRNLIELANHLAQIPILDLAIYSGKIQSVEQAKAMDEELRCKTVRELLQMFDEGINKAIETILAISDEEIREKKLKPFYESGEPKSWSHYILELITHIAMHKMQLWMYLRLAGKPVTMLTYYGIKEAGE